MEITETHAKKIIDLLGYGLRKGNGSGQNPGDMCVEEVVCAALELPHSDDPICVSRAVRSLKIRLNDSKWSSNEARANGLKRLALAQLGTRDTINDKEFVKRVTRLVIQKQLPIALRAAASIQTNDIYKQALLTVAKKCEKEGNREAALEAKRTADAAYADAAANAANAANAADAAANAADAAANAADAAAAYAAYAKSSTRDKVLSEFAEDIVSILIDMKAPGCQWLYLTEETNV